MYKKKRGFTLIEVLLVVVILAILATIAIPSVSGVLNNANNSVDNANAGLYESALKIYVSQKAQCKEYVTIHQMPGHQDLVANSIALVVNDKETEFKCKTRGWAFYYHPITLQVVAMEYNGEENMGMIALVDSEEIPIIGSIEGPFLE